MIRRAAGVHTAAPNEATIAEKIGGTQVFVIPFGINREWLTERSTVQKRQLKKPVTFVYLGRLSAIHKGLDLVLEAFGKLSRQGYGEAFRLVLAGTSEDNSLARLKQKARALDIQHVTFPGGTWGAEKQELWANGDFYVHMARFNGFAQASREALAQGLPLITTRESDLGDWVHKHNMGTVVPLEAEALADQLIQLLNVDPGHYQSMTQNAWKFARDTNWRAVAQSMSDEYMKVLS